jgi:hypothetical protein
MGSIISSKVLLNGNILFKIVLSEEEVRNLKNAMRNIHLFSAELCDVESKVIEKGKAGVTKYFLVPICLRTRKKIYPKTVRCHKVETDTKVFFIYILDKGRIL